MKKMIASLLVIVSAQAALATSLNPAKVVASLQGLDPATKISAVTLLNDGTLQIKQSEITKSVKLQKAAAEKLLELAGSLMNIEVTKTQHAAVCEIMVIPTLSNLSVALSPKSSRTQLILTETGCQYPLTVVPKNENELMSANALRKSLEVLALNEVSVQTSEFVCRPSVNCMPPIFSADAKKYCSPEYTEWARENNCETVQLQ